MWGRLREQVTNLRVRGERDIDENDTIVSRALLRYYEPQVPAWLVPPGGFAHGAHPIDKTPSPPVTQTHSPQAVYARRPSTEPKPHMFDRVDRRDSAVSVAPQSPAGAKPSSGLASRLKNSKW